MSPDPDLFVYPTRLQGPRGQGPQEDTVFCTKGEELSGNISKDSPQVALQDLLNKCIPRDENGQVTATMIQTRNHSVVTKAEDGSRAILEIEVIALGCGQ